MRFRVVAVVAVAVVAVSGCGGCEHAHGAHGASSGSATADDDDPSCNPAQPRQCIGADVVACEPEGKLGRRIRTCKAGCEAGACIATCADAGTELIYVVDNADELMSFDPRKLPDDPFHLVGTLECPRSSGAFSMAVDRHGKAWVLFQNGMMFTASILDAKCNVVPPYTNGEEFGMGYVSDAAGSDAETLYVAVRDGSRELRTFANGRLHTVGTLTAVSEAMITEMPELTGTSGGRLFGFYPVLGAPSFVQEIDKATGAPRGPQWFLGDQSLEISAWAFAQWGGVFYVFVSTGEGSMVYAVNPKTNDARVVRRDLPYRITGAGVSTCAPERDGQP